MDSGSSTETATQYSPQQDADWLCSEARRVVKDLQLLKPATKAGRFRNVFLTGATGFVGRMVLHALLSASKRIKVYCLVRGDCKTRALARIQGVLEEARIWSDSFGKRIIVVLGDLCCQHFDVSDAIFLDLGNTIDAVYHCGGATSRNFFQGYQSVRSTNTLSLAGILALCTSTKVKPLYFLSSLGQFASFFALFSKQYKRDVISENSFVDTDRLRDLVNPNEIGLPWSKWACEQALLKEAFAIGLPGAIFRIPPLWIGCKAYGFADKKSFSTMLIAASAQEALFPMGVSTAPITPVDVACEMLVSLSFNPNGHHRIYHLLNPATVTSAELMAWAGELGFHWKGASWDQFAEAVRRRGPQSPCFDILPVLERYATYWFDPWPATPPPPEGRRSVGELPISTAHLKEDLPHTLPLWPTPHHVFKSGFIYLTQQRVFLPETLAIDNSLDYCLNNAHALSGLSDLGPDPDYFLGPLRIFFASANSDVQLTFVGKLANSRTITQYLANVMYMVDMAKNYPQIEQQEVTNPVFIVGLNRSGTTFLHHLLGADPDTRTTTLCEMIAPYGRDGQYQPVGVPCNAPWDNDPRSALCREICNQQIGLNREFTAMHLRRAVQPEEDIIPFEHCGRSYSFCVGYQLPSFRSWLFADDMKEVSRGYSFHKRFLQHLQWQRPANRGWVLKMPFHLLTLDTLFETYPDAKIIFAHRDPVAVVTSWCKLEAVIQEHFMEGRDPTVTGQNGLEVMSLMMEKSLNFRRSHPELADRFYDVFYDDLIDDPIATVNQLYAEMNWKLSRTATNRMWQYIMDNRVFRPLIQRESEAAQMEIQRNQEEKLAFQLSSLQSTDLLSVGNDYQQCKDGTSAADSGELDGGCLLTPRSSSAMKSGGSGWKESVLLSSAGVSPLKLAGINVEMVKDVFKPYIESYHTSQQHGATTSRTSTNILARRLGTFTSLMKFYWSNLVADIE